MDFSSLPGGIFKTLLELWNVVKDTYVTIFAWMGETGFQDSTVLMALLGSGLFAILAYWIVKFFIP